MKSTGIALFVMVVVLLVAGLAYMNQPAPSAPEVPENAAVVEEERVLLEEVVEETVTEEETHAYAEEKYKEEERIIEVPYVGMPEAEIANTSLGAPSDVGSNMKVTWNTKKMVTIYYFREDGNQIYCARCIDGRVVTVSDYRNEERSSYVPRKSTTKKEEDRYNASDYRNAEDFYDDNYYNFFDYYDAEKYYREHTR